MPKRPPKASDVTPQTAIAAALAQNWKEAISLNTELVKKETSDVSAINRLAYAYLKSGQIAAAKRAVAKVLTIDPYNQIALKNSKKLTTLKRKDLVTPTGERISPLLFLEEPGKTKIVALVNPAPSHVLAGLTLGQEVALKARNHCVEIRTGKNAYLGVIPDDLSFRLLKLLAAGNRYQANLKSIGKNSLTVIVREMSRGKRFASHPSFTPTGTYLPGVRPTTGEADLPDVTPTGEDDGEEAEASRS